MWYTEWHFLRCVFEVFFFMVIHAVRSRQAGWEGFMASKRDLKTIRMHTFVVHYGRRGVSRYLDHREGQKERGKKENP